MTSNARILLVCVDSDAARSLTDRLHGLGHTVCAATPGREGFEGAGSGSHLALIDLDEDAGGIEVAAELVRRAAVPIVYLVGDVDERVLKRARETDPFGYVVKPVDSRQLRLTVDAALSRRAATSQARGRQETDWRLLPELEDRHTAVRETVLDTDGLVVAGADGRFVMVDGVLGVLGRCSTCMKASSRPILVPHPSGTDAFLDGECTPPQVMQFLPRLPWPVSLPTTPTSSSVPRAARPGFASLSAASKTVALDSRGGIFAIHDVARQMRLERDLSRRIEQLHEQTEFMRSAFDNMSDGLVFFDTPSRSVLINAPARRIAKLEEYEDIDQWNKRTELLHARDMSPCAAEDRPIARALRGERVENCELVLRTRNPQHDTYLTVDGMPLRRQDGTLRGAAILFRDVTDSKLQEAKLRNFAATLRNQTKTMRAVLDSMSDGVMAVNARGIFTVFNTSAERFVGGEATDTDSDEWSSTHGLFLSDGKTLVAKKDLPLVMGLRGMSLDAAEFVVRNASNPQGVRVSVNATPIPGADGKPNGAVAVFRDITRIKEAEHKLRDMANRLHERHQLMDLVFDSISDGVVVADATGRLTTANPSAERMVGMGILDLGPDEWSAAYGTFYRDEVTPFPSKHLPLVRAIKGKDSDDVDLFIRNPHVPAGVHISVSGRPMYNSAGRVVGGVIVLHDTTQRVRSREAVMQAFSEGRLEVIDTVLHNIGNAINSVVTGVDTLHERTLDNEVVCRFSALADTVMAHRDDWIEWLRSDPQGRNLRPFLLALIRDLQLENESLRRTATRVSSRVRHIVDIIRKQDTFTDGTVERTTVALQGTIRDAVRVLDDSLVKRGIAVTIECADATPDVRLKEAKFHQMVVNLVKNAMEAITERLGRHSGGEIEPLIRIIARTERRGLVIDVTDNGIGVDPKQLQRIFVAGYTTKPNGSGLGLHSAANYVISSGGSIDVLSEGIGYGTTVRVTLPSAPPGSRGGRR